MFQIRNEAEHTLENIMTKPNSTLTLKLDLSLPLKDAKYPDLEDQLENVKFPQNPSLLQFAVLS